MQINSILLLLLDCEQSLFFLLSSSSRGKTSRKPARGILGKDETREARKIGTADNLLVKIKRVRQATKSCDWSVPEIAVNGFLFAAGPRRAAGQISSR